VKGSSIFKQFVFRLVPEEWEVLVQEPVAQELLVVTLVQEPVAQELVQEYRWLPEVLVPVYRLVLLLVLLDSGC
jgi:hypothetical protein